MTPVDNKIMAPASHNGGLCGLASELARQMRARAARSGKRIPPLPKRPTFLNVIYRAGKAVQRGLADPDQFTGFWFATRDPAKRGELFRVPVTGAGIYGASTL